jgi:hypothetical protein
MATFGVRKLEKVLHERRITLPKNVLPYGFSSPNQRSRLRNLTLQQDKKRRLKALVEELARAGRPIVWFMHLDDRTRQPASALHEGDTPDAVRLFWLRSDCELLLNVTDHPPGVRIDTSELTQAEIERHAAWRPDELNEVHDDIKVEIGTPNAHDARKRTLASIVVRQGQPSFRAALIAAYRCRCAITGNDCEAVLEAAHIRPYAGPQSNVTSNGLLLRADIHTLFDLALIAVNPENLTVRIASRLRSSPYGPLHGSPLASVPLAEQDRPDKHALAEHQRHASLMHGFG